MLPICRYPGWKAILSHYNCTFPLQISIDEHFKSDVRNELGCSMDTGGNMLIPVPIPIPRSAILGYGGFMGTMLRVQGEGSNFNYRRIYIANFAIFKIATFWSYLRENSRSFVKLKLRKFLVGSAHVRSQATVHAFMHASHAVCMRAEDIYTRFKERA